MKRTYTLILPAVAAALFGGLVYAVLVVARVAEPAATTVHEPTVRRLWATGSAVLALVAVLAGRLALARPAGRFGTVSARFGTIVAGAVAAVTGVLLLTLAQGGPGSGDGVVGAAAALVLGLIAVILGGLALARSRGIN